MINFFLDFLLLLFLCGHDCESVRFQSVLVNCVDVATWSESAGIVFKSIGIESGLVNRVDLTILKGVRIELRMVHGIDLTRVVLELVSCVLALVHCINLVVQIL